MVSNDRTNIPAPSEPTSTPAYGRLGEHATDEPEVHKTTEVIASTSTVAAIGGAAAVVLAIIALSHMLPNYLAPIAVIVLSAALLIDGAGFAARFQRLVHQTYGSQYGRLSVSGGVGVEFIGGAAGVVLGILALIGIYPQILLACAVIALGAAALLSVGTMTRMNHFLVDTSGAHPHSQQAASYAITASANAQGLVGAGAIVLGILALVGFVPLILNLVGILALGAGIFLGGSAVVSKLSAISPH